MPSNYLTSYLTKMNNSINMQGQKGDHKHSLKKTYTTFASTVSAHGFQYTIEGSKKKRAFAIVLVFVFSITSFTLATIAIKDFFEGPGFNSEYKLVYSESDEAPSLAVFAICDIAPWDLQKAEQMGISVQMVSYLAYFIFAFDTDWDQKDQEQLAGLEEEYVVLVEKFGSATAVLDAVTRSCEETIFICYAGT